KGPGARMADSDDLANRASPRLGREASPFSLVKGAPPSRRSIACRPGCRSMSCRLPMEDLLLKQTGSKRARCGARRLLPLEQLRAAAPRQFRRLFRRARPWSKLRIGKLLFDLDAPRPELSART